MVNINRKNPIAKKISVDKNPIFIPTYRCNKKCEYCYAETGGKDMSLSRWKMLLGFYKDAVDGINGITILGGEPTIVPAFNDYLLAVADVGFLADVYTNGTFSHLEHPDLMNPKVVREIYFHLEPSQMNFSEMKNFLTNMEIAKSNGLRVTLRYNFHGMNFDFSAIFDILKKFDVPLSWSVSHPTINHTSYVHAKDFPEIRNQIAIFLKAADDAGIRMKLGIPLPICIYKPQDYIKYKEQFGLNRKCSPIGDVNPDGTIQYCAVVSHIKFGPIQSIEELVNAIRYIRDPANDSLRSESPFEICRSCKMKAEHSCHGGCLAYQIHKS